MDVSTPPQSNPAPDSGQVEAVARHYVEGWYTGDADRMDRALHDDLTKRVPDGEDGSLRQVSKDRMVQLTAEGVGKSPDVEFQIFIDDVADDIATVRVLSPDFLDYLHIARTSDGWKIVNILFHNRD